MTQRLMRHSERLVLLNQHAIMVALIMKCEDEVMVQVLTAQCRDTADLLAKDTRRNAEFKIQQGTKRQSNRENT